MVETVNGYTPRIGPRVFIAPGAVVMGDVELAEDVSVWYGCVLRGDINWIRIGPRTNIQDGSVIHVAYKGQGTSVGSDVVIGHRVVLHSCTIADKALIGIGAVVLDGAKVGEAAVVAAGSVVPPGHEIPPRTLAAGVPARPIRELGPEDLARTQAIVERYQLVARCHADRSLRVDLSGEQPRVYQP